jgi:nitronate monooxygenase
MDDKKYSSPRGRAEAFTGTLGIHLPILLAPWLERALPHCRLPLLMQEALGACGTLLMEPEAINAWSANFRRQSQGVFQLNLWIPEPVPVRDFELEKQQRENLAAWGSPVPAGLRSIMPAMIAAAPKAISSIMGLYSPNFIAELKARGILWFAKATTVAETRAAEAAGADAIIAQGTEAGGTSRSLPRRLGRTSDGGPDGALAADG